MNNKIRIILSALILWGIGALFHFVYDWIDIKALAWLFPINESIFEHTKLVFLPFTLYYLGMFILRKDNLCNLVYRANLSIISGVIVEVVCYYTISGIIGRDIAFINILILLVSFICALYVDDKRDKDENHDLLCSLSLYLSMLFFIIVMTYCPFNISFFEEENFYTIGF